VPLTFGLPTPLTLHLDLDVVSVPASQACVERLFFAMWRFYCGKEKHDEQESNLYIRVFLKMNSKHY